MKNLSFKIASAIIILALLPLLFGCEKEQEIDENKVTLTEAEMELYNLIISYRAELSLPSIPLSSSLSYVAQQHVADLQLNNPITPTCNVYSWSDNGDWTACCYTIDHSQASCMWNKPKELTDYEGNGYEIAIVGPNNISPTVALNVWKNSTADNNVIINGSVWTREWKAIGVGMKGNYAVVWFGHEVDPAGPPN